MKVVIAPQAFKGALSGAKAAEAIAAGIRLVIPEAKTTLLPVADGGDGTLEALVENTNGHVFTSHVNDPFMNPIKADWGVMGDGETAVIEMARASGLVLVPPEKRDPRHTTTFGTGQLIKEAIAHGYRRIIVGMGGSATNDGGAGMAKALGVRFFDNTGTDLPAGGAFLSELKSIDISSINPSLRDTNIIAASDVTNPLCGAEGASAIYGPQKGATSTMVGELDSALLHYASIVEQTFGIEVSELPGAGAAGGLGAGLIAFANGRVQSGIDLVCDVLSMDSHLEGADLVITGEGKVDHSTIYDKAPIGVARRAKALGVKVLIIAGGLGRGYEDVYAHGVDAVTCISDHPMPLRTSIQSTYPLLVNATARAMRMLLLDLAR
ncbi:glycerate kinase [SAR202 cluster bacterium AD-804-J14_MRT_500m]|nr:glycerate kinase [SAR202 cluster bacterium AD-804-J14_MRT_500m]